MAGVNTGGLTGAALKRAIAYNAALEKAEKSMAKQQKLIGGISSSLLGIDGGDFFRGLTEGELAKKLDELNSKMKTIQTEAKSQGEVVSGTFKEMAKEMGLANMGTTELQAQLGISKEHAKKLSESFDESGQYIGDIDGFMKELGDDGDKFLTSITDTEKVSEDLVKEFEGGFDKLQEINGDAKILKDQIDNANESVFSLGEGFKAAGENLKNGALKAIGDFDQAIKKSQLETGINFTENTTQMAMLTSESAKFGMSVGDTADLMGGLSKELRTTNFDVLAGAAEDLIAMQKATGLAAGDTAKLAKEFIKFGKTSKDVKKFSEETMQMSVAYGVSGKAVMEDMAANLGKMRTMGFVGGEQSLRKMVLESKRLGMSVDEIFETGKRARNMEGAMEMAAELQLAGGSFAAINPMELLSAARKGPKELQALLGQMGSDIGSWNEETQKYEFDPVDIDRLQMIEDATGQSVESLTNMIGQNAEDVKKADLLGGLGGSLDGMTDEEKAFFMQMSTIGENGELKMTGSMEGVDDLSTISQKTIKEAMVAEKAKQDSLEKQAQENMSFTETLDGLKNSIFNAFAIFQPVLETLSTVLQWINNSMDGWGKLVVGLGVVFGGMLFSAAKWILQGINLAKGFQIGNAGSGGFLKSARKALGGALGMGGGKGGEGMPKTEPGPKGGSGWIAKMAQGIKKFGKVKYGDIVKFGFALVTIGAAVVLFMMGIAASGGADGAALASAAGAMIILAGGLWLSTKILGKMSMKDVIMGALAMGIMGLALIPFAFAAQMMSDVDWLSVLAGVGIAILVVLLLTLLGVGMMYAMPFLLWGAAALVIAGLALLIGAVLMGTAGEYLVKAIGPLEQIGDADWTALLPFASVISAFGFSMVFGAIGLLAGAIALYFAAPLLAASVEPLKKIADTNWEPLKSFAEALSHVGPAMLGFALSGLLLLNPWMLLGLVTILGALSFMGIVMNGLAPDLSKGADGIERMAEGVLSLDSAVKSLDIDRLAKLRNIAVSMAFAGGGMGKMIKALDKVGGAGGGDKKVTHIVKLQLDGKQIQEIILRDTDKSS